MKRKRFSAAAKGTHPITKFFKRASESNSGATKILDCEIIIDSLGVYKGDNTVNTARKTKENVAPTVNNKRVNNKLETRENQPGNTIKPPETDINFIQQEQSGDTSLIKRNIIIQTVADNQQDIQSQPSENKPAIEQSIIQTEAASQESIACQPSEGTTLAQQLHCGDTQAAEQNIQTAADSQQNIHSQSSEELETTEPPLQQQLSEDKQLTEEKRQSTEPHGQSNIQLCQLSENTETTQADSPPIHCQITENTEKKANISQVTQPAELEKNIENQPSGNRQPTQPDTARIQHQSSKGTQPAQLSKGTQQIKQQTEIKINIENQPSRNPQSTQSDTSRPSKESQATKLDSTQEQYQPNKSYQNCNQNGLCTMSDSSIQLQQEAVKESEILLPVKDNSSNTSPKISSPGHSTTVPINNNTLGEGTSGCFEKEVNYKNNNSCNTDMENDKNEHDGNDIDMEDCNPTTDEQRDKVEVNDNTNNKNTPSKTNEECVDDDDESDDELLSPPVFLCDHRTKPEIKTPEKSFTSITDSPLTPISPYKQQENKETVKCRYSLAKLVLEKPKQEEKDKEMARLQNAIHEQIEKGRMARLTGTESEDGDDETELLPTHQKELDNFAPKDKEFNDEIPGENVFPEFKKPVKYDNGCCQPFPPLQPSTGSDSFTMSLFKRSDIEIEELLCGGWIVQRYLLRPYSKDVIQWLFHLLSYHLDNQTIQATYNALWSLLNAESTSDDKNKPSFPWFPSIEDFFIVLYNYGATKASLRQETEERMNTAANEESVGDTKCEEDSLFPQINLTRLIQFITLSLARSPQQYNDEQLEQLVITLCCLSLDLRLDMCLHDIKTCLEAAYSAFEKSQWSSQAKKLSSIISKLVLRHRHKLHLVQIQPYSCRGRDIRRLVALKTLSCLVDRTLNEDQINEIILPDQNDQDKEITDVVKCLEMLEKVIYEIRITEDTDYYKLYTIMEILDLAVGAETLLPTEKVVLERLTARLRLFHRDIKDPRAMFISRTKVKDLILRTTSKFVFMTQGKKDVQRGITQFFDKSESDLYIENLKDAEEDVDTEISFGSGSSSPASEISETTDNQS